MHKSFFPNLLKWVLALLIAVFFIYVSIFFKFRDAVGDNIIFATIAQKSGLSLFEPYIRYLVGAMEVVAAILLVIPKSRCLGALLAFGILTGALGFHLSPWLGIAVPVEINSTQTDGGMLFFMAIILWIFSIILCSFYKKCFLGLLCSKKSTR